ncbi:MAG TPA: alpha-galactosidase [Tepidisphaeraceae bacterium]|nr:alpha-galactosidase [Tepidisphaeraceae bacterium]
MARATAEPVQVKTATSVLQIEPREGGVAIVSLRSAGGTAQWIPPSATAATIPWINHAQLDGKARPIHWRLDRSEPGDHSATFHFVSAEPELELESAWIAAPGPGPVEHRIRIRNRGTKPVLVPAQRSLELSSAAGDGKGLETWWVEKGGSTPTPVGIHRDRVTSQFDLKLRSGPVQNNRSRDPIPFIAVQSTEPNEGWYAGIEFSGRVAMRLKARSIQNQTVFDAQFGLDSDNELCTLIPPGGVYEPPVTFIGCFRGDMDDCGNQLRPWVAEHLRPSVHDPKYPLLVNNSWGTGMAVTDKLVRSMVDQSVDLGLEMVHIDAGWFRSTGDWRPSLDRFPHGLRPVSDYAHEKGLRFGLWVGWTQGGNQQPIDDPSKTLSVRDPSRVDWFPQDYPANWKPAEFSGATVCLADPSAESWCLNLLRKIVKDNRLELLEHDQRMIVERCSRTDHTHTASPADVSFRACEAYYRIYDALRAENPNLLFEDCVNGGQMVDFGVIRRVHYISITDTYDPLSNRRAFYDASYLIPPAMCECYVAQHPGKTDANFLYMLRSGMMGWCTIMLDTTQWTPRQHALAKRQFELYKTRLRPMINSARLYHVSPRPDGVKWDGIEYCDQQASRAILFAFRGSTNDARHTFQLRGLDPKRTYAIQSEDGNPTKARLTGEELMRDGIEINLSEPDASDIVYLTAN